MFDPGLIDALRSGDRRALARAITLAESGEALPPLDAPQRRIVGVTGPPGAGKSSLVNALIGVYRRRGETVAVLAVDPSSPKTGGAILGDRIRMQDHTGDPGVYIRSMANRGHMGGLAPAAADALRLMAAAGFDRLIVETVGVGQTEVEVMEVADTVVLVLTPAWGDEIQADKAGILEVADLVVVNKADRPGAGEVRRALASAAEDHGFRVLLTSTVTGEGIEELADLL
ncbi:MAG: methylmalonyl Co-A mutase-associated GTPase MeaB [Actinomycetes bacterium]|nr:MAG: methylmalonyl Co-A mutase-associated GTPase MeaB [Actinomycetota bacterium]